MKNFFRFLLLLPLLFYLEGCNKPTSILLVVGGHSYDTTEFYQMFRSLDGIIFDSASYPGAREMLRSDRLHAYDVLVFYDYQPEMPEEDSSLFINLAREGKPMLFLHHALCSFQAWDGYMGMVGGKYVMPAYSADSKLFSDYAHDIDLEVMVLPGNHPVTQGVTDFKIRDEGYSNIMVLDGVTPLLTTDHPDCSSMVGWTHTHLNSTSVYLLLGHDMHSYENESYRQLLSNSIYWLAGQN